MHIHGDTYLVILQNHVIPYLKTQQKCSRTIFQQGGAASHMKNNAKELLHKTFTEDRFISLHFKNLLPPRYVDTTPLDFWYWVI